MREENELVVSEKYKSYVEEREFTVNLSSYNAINLPLNSSGFTSLINLEKACFEDSILRCEILNQTIENIVSLLYDDSSVKSQSLVTYILSSDLENSDNLLSIEKYQLTPKSKESSVAKCSISVYKVVAL